MHLTRRFAFTTSFDLRLNGLCAHFTEEETENRAGNQRWPTTTQHYEAHSGVPTPTRMTPKPGLLLTLGGWEERPGPGRVQAQAPNERTRRHPARPSTSKGLKFPSASNFLTSTPGSYCRPVQGVPGASRAAPPERARPAPVHNPLSVPTARATPLRPEARARPPRRRTHLPRRRAAPPEVVPCRGSRK